MSKRKRTSSPFRSNKKINLFHKTSLNLLNTVPPEIIHTIAETMAKSTNPSNLTETRLAFHLLTQEYPFVNTVNNWNNIYSGVQNFDVYLPPQTKKINNSPTNTLNTGKFINTSKQYSSSILPKNRSSFNMTIPMLSYKEQQGYNKARNSSRICPNLLKLLNSLTISQYLDLAEYFYITRFSRIDWNEIKNYTGGDPEELGVPGSKVEKYFTKDEYFNKQCYKFNSLNIHINDIITTVSMFQLNTPNSLLNTLSRNIIAPFIEENNGLIKNINIKQTDIYTLEIKLV